MKTKGNGTDMMMTTINTYNLANYIFVNNAGMRYNVLINSAQLITPRAENETSVVLKKSSA